MLGSDGAMLTASRPHGPFGRPGAVEAFSGDHVVPPSRVTNMALPEGASGLSPPERKVQPLRRKSHSVANSFLGVFGSMASDEQPVDRFDPLRISAQVLPPSVVR